VARLDDPLERYLEAGRWLGEFPQDPMARSARALRKTLRGEPLFSFPLENPRGVLFLAGERVLGGSESGRLAVWSLRTQEKLYELAGNHSVQATEDRALFAVSAADGVITFRADGREVRRYAFGARVEVAAFSADSRLLAIGGHDPHVLIYELDSGDLRGRVGPHLGPVEALTFSSDGTEILTGTGTEHVMDKNLVSLFRIDLPERLWSLPMVSRPTGSLRAGEGYAVVSGAMLAIHSSRGGHTRAFQDDRGPNRNWQVLGRLARRALAHPGRISSLTLSPDGKTLFSAAGARVDVKEFGNDVRAWRVSDGHLLNAFKPVRDKFFSVDVSPDGDLFALTSYRRGSIDVWLTDAVLGADDVPEALAEQPGKRPAKPTAILGRGGGGSVAVAFRDDRTLLSLNTLGELSTWDVAQGTLRSKDRVLDGRVERPFVKAVQRRTAVAGGTRSLSCS
jgi:WD40 repeat protein